MGFPAGSAVKNLPAHAGHTASTSGSGRFPGGGKSNLLHCSCLEDSMHGGAWGAAVHGGAKSRT